MSNTKHTPGPWRAAIGDNYKPTADEDRNPITTIEHDIFDAIDVFGPKMGIHGASYEEHQANALLIAYAPKLYEQNQSLLEALKEMKRYLPVLERLEAMPGTWESLTKGTGIATLNGYRNAIKQAEQ